MTDRRLPRANKKAGRDLVPPGFAPSRVAQRVTRTFLTQPPPLLDSIFR